MYVYVCLYTYPERKREKKIEREKEGPAARQSSALNKQKKRPPDFYAETPNGEPALRLRLLRVLAFVLLVQVLRQALRQSRGELLPRLLRLLLHLSEARLPV